LINLIKSRTCRLLLTLWSTAIIVTLVSCATTEEPGDTSEETTEVEQRKVVPSPENSRQGDAVLRVTGSDGKALPGVLIISSRLMDLSGQYTVNKPNKTLAEAGLLYLLQMNPAAQWDFLIHTPDDRVRVVGISNSEGKVFERLETNSLHRAVRVGPPPVVYVFVKTGYQTQVISRPLFKVLEGGEISITMQTSAITNNNAGVVEAGPDTPDANSAIGKPEITKPDAVKTGADTDKPKDATATKEPSMAAVGDIVETMIINNLSAFSISEVLDFQQRISVRPAEAKLLQVQYTRSLETIRTQLAISKNNIPLAQECRLRYWLARTQLNILGMDYNNYNPESEALKAVESELGFIKSRCQDPHLISLMLVDERDVFINKRQWFYRNKVPTAKWPASMNWNTFKRDWIINAEKLDKTQSKRLWPVFHRTLSQMYNQGYWSQQYEKLGRFKEEHPLMYGQSDERERASSALMNASRYKRLAKAKLDDTRLEQTRAEALKWFLLASDLGNCVADREIGDMYENGILVDADYKQALFWYRNGLFKDCEIRQVVADLQSRILRVLKLAEEKSQLQQVLEIPGNSAGSQPVKSPKSP